MPPASFEVYSEKYADFFVMTRRTGILELRCHTDGGPYIRNWAAYTP